MQVPSEGNRAQPWAPNAAFLYTGQDREAAEGLTSLMFPTPDPTPEQFAAALSWAAKGNESVSLHSPPLVQLHWVPPVGCICSMFQLSMPLRMAVCESHKLLCHQLSQQLINPAGAGAWCWHIWRTHGVFFEFKKSSCNVCSSSSRRTLSRSDDALQR